MPARSPEEEILLVLGQLKQSLKRQQKEGVVALPITARPINGFPGGHGSDASSLPPLADAADAIGPQETRSFDDDLKNLSFDELRQRALGCQKCPLHKTRTRVVFGAGNPHAELMFVGEAPGHDEDLQGLPFVGRAGQLLTKIIEAMGFRREEVYIANILKCRPPNNRAPQPAEIEQCEPYLLAQIDHIKPKALVALGSFAVQTLLRTDRKISGLRGLFHDYHGIRLMPTYHPAYLLRNPNDKKLVWDDMKQVMAFLNKPAKK